MSVVIPARDEAAWLGRTLEAVGAPWQVIVVDGGSDDHTIAVAREHGAEIVAGEPGRATQMNAGAAAATGDALLFLHADTLLPEGYERIVAETLSRPGVVAGAFAFRLDDRRWSLRAIERSVAWRCRRRQMPFGDQGLFMTAGTFEAVGAYPALPIMEDYEIVRRLRDRGRVDVSDAPAVTSSRRWREHGVWRTTLLNRACIVAYRCGVDPARIARWRSRSSRSRSPARPTRATRPVRA